MRDLRKAVLQALAFTMRDFATVRDFEAARAKLRDSLRAALDSDTGETTMHSTGPWTAMVTDTMGDTPALWDIVQRSSGGTVAEIQSHNPDDAALVAAAPDLLAALQLVHANAGESPEWIRSRIAPVIARATGDQ